MSYFVYCLVIYCIVLSCLVFIVLDWVAFVISVALHCKFYIAYNILRVVCLYYIQQLATNHGYYLKSLSSPF